MSDVRAPQRLGTDSLIFLILRLAIPTAFAQAVMVLYTIIDKLFIAHIGSVGALAIAGVGVASPITSLVSSFSVLVGLGGAPLMAMKAGHGDEKEAEEVLGMAFSILLLLSLVLTPFFFSMKGVMLHAFGASADSFPFALDYLGVYLLGTPFALLANGLNFYLINQGRSKEAMLAMVAGALVNVALDPLFIFTFALGCKGAAAATIISQAISALLVIVMLSGKFTPLHFHLVAPRLSVVKRIFLLGLSPFLIISTDSILLILLNTVLQNFSTPERGDMLITAATIIQSWHVFFMNTLGGITGGCQGMISYNYGAGKSERVKKGIGCVALFSCIYSILFFALTHLFGAEFISFFTSDAALQALTKRYLFIFTMAIIPLSFQYSNVDCFTALAQVRCSLPLSLFRKGIFLFVLLAFPPIFGAASAFYAEPICDLLSALVSTSIMIFFLPRILAKREKEGLDF